MLCTIYVCKNIDVFAALTYEGVEETIVSTLFATRKIPTRKLKQEAISA
jgi:hypothetical protein